MPQLSCRLVAIEGGEGDAGSDSGDGNGGGGGDGDASCAVHEDPGVIRIVYTARRCGHATLVLGLAGTEGEAATAAPPSSEVAIGGAARASSTCDGSSAAASSSVRVVLPASVRVRVVHAASHRFHHEGRLAGPMGDGFYDVLRPRAFALASELSAAAAADESPPVLLVDLGHPRLQTLVAQARHALGTPPPASEAADPAAAVEGVRRSARLLALLTSSWLGGHWDTESQARADLELVNWRRVNATNLVPVGALRHGGRRPRALLYKRLFDELVGAGCTLQRADDGQPTCVLALPGSVQEPAELYCGS